MKVIVLAAGIGRRLYPLTEEIPKCLLKVGDKTLLEHALFNFERLGVREVVIVTGHGSEKVEERVSSFNLPIKFTFNPDYASKDNIYSLWCVRGELESGSMIFNSDVICHPAIIKGALASTEVGRDFLVIDDSKTLDHEDMKVKLDSGRIRAISKDLPVSAADGEYIGIAGFSPSGGKVLAEILERLIEERRVHEFYEAAFQEMVPLHKIEAVSTQRLPWTEIDDFDDLREAEESLLPEIGGSTLA